MLHSNKANNYSWNNTNLESYQFIDISDFSIKEIQYAIIKFQPEAFLFVSFKSLMELLLRRICTIEGIKTIYIQHGVVSKYSTKYTTMRLKTDLFDTLKKNIIFLLKYFKFIYTTKNSIQEFQILCDCIFKRTYFNAKFDHFIFFSDYAYESINKIFKTQMDCVSISGYPLVSTIKQAEQLEKMGYNNKSKKIILIHQPFIADKLTSWDYDTEKNYFLKLFSKINQMGFSLTILLHPRENLLSYTRLYENTEIEIRQSFDLKDYSSYSFAIGFYSTALFYPLFLGIPISIIDYDTIKAKSSVFYEISEEISVNQLGNKAKYEKFRLRYLGDRGWSFEYMSDLIKRCLPN